MCSPASEMSGRKYLLLFTVFMLLETCQTKPQVTMSPELKEIFSGDSFYLNCNNRGSGVKWYFNDKEKHGVKEIWKIAVAFPMDSGSYRCESNGEKSDNFDIKITDLAPRASLTVKTGHPVMQFGHSANLQIHNDDGLAGWMCHVYRESKKERKKVKLMQMNISTLVFQTARLTVPETIYWCTDQTEQNRSNQIILRASAEDISLEMYPQPAVHGKSLALRCLVWGTDQITKAVFYKDNKTIHQGTDNTYTIPVVTESTQGKYRCDATYTYKGNTLGPPYQRASEFQDVIVQVPPIKASLSITGMSMSCSCSICQSDTHCFWYDKTDRDPLKHLNDLTSCHLEVKKTGSYACRAVWGNKWSELSDVHFVPVQTNPVIIIAIIVFLVLVALICFGIAFYKYKKRSTQNQIYEDLPMHEREYDILQKGSDAKREGEYDILQPQAPDKDKTTGEYEALKKGGAKDEVYHTLGGEGAAAEGGDGGYQALKKQGGKDEVYHTLKAEGAAAEGGDGGYEALKKQGVKDEVYHTLKAEGAAAEGGDGGYEALKKQGVKDEVYHTLKAEGAAAEGGDGGYEALKKQGEKEGVYHTLKAEGAAAEGGDGGYEALKKEGMKEGVYHTLGAEQKEAGKAGEQ